MKLKKGYAKQPKATKLLRVKRQDRYSLKILYNWKTNHVNYYSIISNLNNIRLEVKTCQQDALN